MNFIQENLGTILVSLLLAVIVAFVIFRLISDRKQGKGSCSCGGNCGYCPMGGTCHKGTEKEAEKGTEKEAEEGKKPEKESF